VKRARPLFNSPPGFLPLRQFVREFESGKIAKTKTTRALASRFKRILADESLDVMRVLDLKPRRGRTKLSLSWASAVKKNGAVWTFLDDYLAGHPAKRGARERAVEAAAEKFGKSERQIERTLKSGAAFMSTLQCMRACNAQLEQLAALARQMATRK
jgi:hypothetical protein